MHSSRHNTHSSCQGPLTHHLPAAAHSLNLTNGGTHALVDIAVAMPLQAELLLTLEEIAKGTTKVSAST